MIILSGRLPRPLASIMLVASLLVSGILAVGVTAGTLRAEDCLTTPNAPATQGQHWYYRTDKAKQRKCWYLRPVQAQQHAQSLQPTAARPNHAPTGSGSLPATPPTAARPQPEAGTGTSVNAQSASSASVADVSSVSTPVATSPGDDAPFSPNINMLSVAPQVTPNIDATMMTPQGGAPPMPQAIAPQESPVPTVASAPADSAAALDSQPAASTATVPNADARGEDARGEDASASDDAESTTVDRAPIAKPSMAGTLKSAPLAMFLLPIFGLAFAGFLVRVVAKMTAARSEPNINTNADSGWIDDYDELEWHEDRGFREIVNDRHEPNFEQHALDRAEDYDELEWHEDRRFREIVDDRREPSFDRHVLDPIDHLPAEAPKPDVTRRQNPAAARGAQPRAMVDEIEALLHAIRQARRHRAA